MGTKQKILNIIQPPHAIRPIVAGEGGLQHELSGRMGIGECDVAERSLLMVY